MVGLAVLVVMVAGAALYVLRPAPLLELDALLTEKDFLPNPGFAATFRPGDVIQLTETDGKGGARQLVRPVLFLKREVCFPGRVPSEVPFGIPATSGQRAVTLAGSGLARVLPALPDLRLGGGGTRSYMVSVDGPRVATFSRGELSDQFAAPCVEAFSAALASGDRPAWFGTVIEAVVADALTVTIEWRADTSGTARAALRQRAGAALTGAGVVAELDSTERTVLRARGPLILGYRYRPMEMVP